MKNKKIKYSSLRPVYSINIMDQNIFKDEKAFHLFKLYDKENEMLLTEPSLLNIGFLELNKETANPNIKYWKEFLKTGIGNSAKPSHSDLNHS